MLMYGQDEYGFISDELIERNRAAAWNSAPCKSKETLQYYSMLHRKPMGKQPIVQICTNVACMLRRRQTNCWSKPRSRLDNRPQRSHHRWDFFFARRSRNALAACTGARQPCMGQLRLLRKSHAHEVLTASSKNSDAGDHPRSRAGNRQARLHPARFRRRLPVISRRFSVSAIPTRWMSISSMTATRRSKKSATGDDAGKTHPSGRRSKNPACRGRAGGAGFPHWHEWSFVSERFARSPKYVICNADESEPWHLQRTVP